jgi:NADPH:quinone reductase-like Zn-dependent oxidoreductase
VLQLREVAKPAPGDHELLIRIRATTVTAGDCELRSLRIPARFRIPLRLYAGVRRPTRIPILGQELAGEIEAVGEEVTRFAEGEPVFGTTGFGFGAYAEYVCLREDGVIATKPSNMTFDEAASVPIGGLESLYFLQRAKIGAGGRLLVNGAGGSIGTFAVQLAKNYRAHVTAVDSTRKLDMLRSIGADEVVDYTQQDFTRSGATYDVVFDVTGRASPSRSIRSLNAGGVFLQGNASAAGRVRGGWTAITRHKRIVGGTAPYTVEGLAFLKELVEQGKIRSVIDRRYPLEQAAQAHRYVETGQKKGSVILTIPPAGNA